MCKCLWSVWKWYRGYKEITSPFTCCPVNREYSWKKSKIEKKANYALQHVRIYRNQSTDLQNKSMDWFLYDKNLHHERVNALLLACIHWDIFLEYDKIIDIYASKYQRRMHLILSWRRPLSDRNQSIDLSLHRLRHF